MSTTDARTAESQLQPWETALWSRYGVGRVPGLMVPTPKKTAVLGSAASVLPTFDVTKMSASAVISTPTPDRSEDVVNPLGGDYSNFKNNPVVFFDHGFSGITFPIAKSEDPDGKLTIKASKENVSATSFFTPSLMESCQIFGLVTESIIRATSINLLPLSATIRKENRDGGRPGLDVEEWELLEWSWVGIPDNPECLAKVHEVIFSKARLDGRPICEPLLKYFAPYAPPKRAIGKGFDSDHENCPNCRGKKMADDPKPEDQMTEEEKAAKARAAKKDPPESEENPMDDSCEKPSAKHLSAVYRAQKQLAALTKSLADSNEHPEIQEFLATQAEFQDGLAEETKARFAKSFPGSPALGEEQDSDVDAKAIQKFLTEGYAPRMRMTGLLPKFEALSSAKGLTTGERQVVTELYGRLGKMLGEARAAAVVKSAEKKDEPAQADPELKAMLEEVRGLAKRHEESLPAA